MACPAKKNPKPKHKQTKARAVPSVVICLRRLAQVYKQVLGAPTGCQDNNERKTSGAP